MALVTLSGWAAGAPVQVVFVPFGAQTLFSLAEGNMDVAYAVVELPANGTLVGIPPHLTYVPRPGFAGMDWVHYLVQTETGQWDFGTVQLVVLAPGTTTTSFVFTSEGEMVFSGPTVSVDSYRFVLGVQARFTYFEQGLRATINGAGFTSLESRTRIELQGTWPSPWRLPITATLGFDPTFPGLRSLTVDARTTIAGLTCSYTFHRLETTPTWSFLFQILSDVGKIVGELAGGAIADELRAEFQTRGFVLAADASVLPLGANAWQVTSIPWLFRIEKDNGRLSISLYVEGPSPCSVVQVQGTVGAYTFISRTTFCTQASTFGSLTFGEQRLVVRGPWICQGCPTDWELDFVQKKAGFDRLSFLIQSVEIPCPGCGSIQTFFDLKVTFTVDEKKVEPALRVTSGWVACVKPLVSLATPTGGFGLAGVDLYGIEIRCEAFGGYILRLATSFNPLRDAAVTGYTRFFELWQLEGPVVPCCGNPGRFQISTYFKRARGTLLGLGMWDIILYFPLSREVLVNVGLKVGEVDQGDPTKTWILTLGAKGLF